MSSRIEQIIEEIEEFVESCKYQPLSTTKIVVNKEELEELLRELRLKTPDEVKRYQKIISNKDAILVDAQEKADKMISDAQAKAEGIIAQAQAQAKEMVSMHEITQQAYEQANAIAMEANQHAQSLVDDATTDANNIRLGAIDYTDSMLGNMENILAKALNEANEKYSAFIAEANEKYTAFITGTNEKYSDYLNSIQGCYEVVAQNRSELNPAAAPAEETSSAVPAEEEDDYAVHIDLEDLE